MAKTFRVTLDTDEKAAYLLAVDDLDFEAVQYACKQIYRQETFMPVPAIMRSYAREWAKAHAQERQPAPTEQQWLRLREAELEPGAIKDFIASLWPEETLKEPPPPYDQEAPHG